MRLQQTIESVASMQNKQVVTAGSNVSVICGSGSGGGGSAMCGLTEGVGGDPWRGRSTRRSRTESSHAWPKGVVWVRVTRSSIVVESDTMAGDRGDGGVSPSYGSLASSQVGPAVACARARLPAGAAMSSVSGVRGGVSVGHQLGLVGT